MTTPLARWLRTASLLAFLGMSTTARAQPKLPHVYEPAAHRGLYLMENPGVEAPEVYVAGNRVTTLRFERPVDPRKTQLLGWEGRFEPLLAGGRSVVIVPLKDLSPEDRFLLRVTLLDGTEVPFTLTASDSAFRDGQLDVYPDPTSPEAVRVLLQEERHENQALRKENHRHREEGTSVDHALAALLANNQISLTPFTEQQQKVLHEEGVKIIVSLLVPKQKVQMRKVAVIFTVTNQHPDKPWKLMEARLSALASQAAHPFALRMFPETLAPEQTGRVVIVTDFSSFDPIKNGDMLAFEIFRDGGMPQGCLVLSTKNLLR